jgi:uncharacterized protein YlzI (FlbEa/FlbD family)
MECSYIALVLNSMGEEINELNIKKMLAVMNKEPDEAELRALMTLVTALKRGKIKEVERKEDKSSLAQRLEKVEDKLLNIERSLKEIRKLTSPEPTKVPLPTESVKSEIKERVSDVSTKSSNKPSEGRYLYGIADGEASMILGKIGIEDSEVYTIPHKKICAIVHNCPLEPYTSDDDEKVKGWVKNHQKVLDMAKGKFSTILPLGFDTIIQPKDNVNSTEVVKDWLKEDYENFQAIIKKVKGKDEYGVQISYDPKIMSELISRQSEEIKKIKEEMASKSPGMAYMYKQKLKKAAKQEVEKLADKYFEEFYGGIKKCVGEIKVEKTKKVDKNKIMMMNLSCLVVKEKVEELGNELERINNMKGLSVHFSGPWPPYSFVAIPTAPARGE